MLRLMAVLTVAAMLSLGCANSAERRNQIITEAAAIIQPPQEKLSKYTNFKLLPMKVATAIKNHEGKNRYAQIIESKLSSRLEPTFASWNKSSKAKLEIQPELLGLRIISGGARFWVGAMAGNSNITLKLTIRDVRRNKVIGTPVIKQEAGAMNGGWSMGATDRNLVGYVVDITQRYITNNY